VGALATCSASDSRESRSSIGEQYKGKEKLLEPNVKALHMGRDYARDKLPAIGLKVKRSDRVGNRIFLEGNAAAALGCVYGGATVAAWYPITPSSSMAEAFSKHCRKYRTDPANNKARYAVVQAEDELASIGMVIGAAWNGARAFTCTSGPGISAHAGIHRPQRTSPRFPR
jgi:2-oxoglutarate ferredoxin oxidoreductase subunit alpha